MAQNRGTYFLSQEEKKKVFNLSQYSLYTFLYHNKNNYKNNEFIEKFINLDNNSTVMKCMEQDYLPFLTYIANHDLEGVKAFLEKNPFLAVFANGTITTFSENTYSDVTAIQLGFLMDDPIVCNILLTYIEQLPKELIKEAYKQFRQKREEVIKQEATFTPYDYTHLVNTINSDSLLITQGTPSLVTQQALAMVENYFSPSVITVGKSMMKKELQTACDVHDGLYEYNDGNFYPDNRIYLRTWFMIHVIGTIQSRAEKYFDQDMSEGLRETEKDLNPSSSKKSHREKFRSSHELGKDYYIDVPSGYLMTEDDFGATGDSTYIQEYCEKTKAAMRDIRDKFETLINNPAPQQTSQRWCQII